MPHFNTAVIVGASSGIGEAVARRLASRGTRVVLVARREAELRRTAQKVSGAPAAWRVHDVTDYGSVPALWDDIETETGPVDLVVYCAGVMPQVGPDEFTFEKDRQMIEVNLLGAMAWLDQAALRMQAAGKGTIVGISSVAGDRGRTGQPAYNTSKAALNTYLEALYNRLWRHGVRVVTVKPGPVLTPMTAGIQNLQGAVDADTAAAGVVAAAASGARVAYVPGKWRVIMFVIRAIPAFLFRRLDI